MPSIRTAISIGQSIDRVFEFVTTVSNFPKWHSSSWTGPFEHPLRAGEHVTEELSLGGRHARIQWIVRESSPPRRWVIGGKSEDGGTATITYTLIPESQGTRFKREFVYNMPVLFGELGDFLSLQSRLQAESAESLRRLKRILESDGIKGCHDALIGGTG
ncbi:MAG: SRPBCC family protein [Gammaproteobacteria bacterium]